MKIELLRGELWKLKYSSEFPAYFWLYDERPKYRSEPPKKTDELAALQALFRG
ncbi:hypothetical protein G8759_01755 [Spirosoma aureum]|uniref:Uncharacterized protein n=1 Tax=Spirosoma aureum TaxID=2692134 RepID=A0A6G9AG71_9BACT|nr:hypothetical protein [Spirosoma aureum]QIP11450.1 hypothetical protein G8759_01755 [Spirosoma aureum]